jgi:hypothetical protein
MDDRRDIGIDAERPPILDLTDREGLDLDIETGEQIVYQAHCGRPWTKTYILWTRGYATAQRGQHQAWDNLS